MACHLYGLTYYLFDESKQKLVMILVSFKLNHKLKTAIKFVCAIKETNFDTLYKLF